MTFIFPYLFNFCIFFFYPLSLSTPYTAYSYIIDLFLFFFFFSPTIQKRTIFLFLLFIFFWVPFKSQSWPNQVVKMLDVVCYSEIGNLMGVHGSLRGCSGFCQSSSQTHTHTHTIFVEMTWVGEWEQIRVSLIRVFCHVCLPCSPNHSCLSEWLI